MKVLIRVYAGGIIRYKRAGGKHGIEEEADALASIESGKVIFVSGQHLTRIDRKRIEEIWDFTRRVFKRFELREITLNLGILKITFKR